MLLLSFHIGTEQYSISAKDIIEILPIVKLKKIPKAPNFVLGLLDYRGTPAPVIDLCYLIESRNYDKFLSSRIIVLNYIDAKDQPHIIGITAEKVTETINVDRDDFQHSGITIEETPFLGAVAKTKDSVIQYIETSKLIPQDVQSILFQDDNLKPLKGH